MTKFQEFALSYLIAALNNSENVKSVNARYFLRNDCVELELASSANPVEAMLKGIEVFRFSLEFTDRGIRFIPLNEDDLAYPIEFSSELTQVLPIGKRFHQYLDKFGY